MADLADLLDNPARVADVPAAELPALVLRLAAVQTAVAVRLGALPTPVVDDLGLVLTPAEVGTVLRIPEREVRDLIRRGALPAVHLSRKRLLVRRADLHDFLAQRVAGGVVSLYSAARDGHSVATNPAASPPDAGTVGGTPRRDRQHGGAVGAGRGAHKRAGRPLDSVRRQGLPVVKEDR